MEVVRVGRRTVRFVVLAAAVVALQFGLGRLAAEGSTVEGLALLALTAGGWLALRGPARLGFLVLPAVYLNQRFAVGGLDLSYADLALIGGVAVCAVQTPWADPIFRRLFTAFALYATVLVVPIAANPSKRAMLEMFHRLFLVVGAVAVGAAVARAGWGRVALRSYVIASAVVAVGAVQYSLSQGRAAAQPWGINKNAGGFLVVCAIVIVVVAKDHLQLWKGTTNPILVVLFAGELAFQSRGSVAALSVVLLLSAWRMPRRAMLVPLAGVGTLALMARATLEMQRTGENARFSSVNGRINTYDEVLELWSQHRWTGMGIRFWNDPVLALSYFGGEPHNLIIAALGEAGIFGAVALVLFLVLALVATRGPSGPWWRCARLLIVAQIVSGTADIYWRAGTGTLPWLVVGIAVGSEVARRSADPTRTLGDLRVPQVI